MPAKVIRRIAHAYACASRAQLCWTLGITEHHNAVDNVLALINLSLLTGHVGRYGSGLAPLRGQNNVQGSTDMGCSPNLYPGYQRVAVPAVRERFESLWGVPLSGKEGLTTPEMLDGALTGSVRAIYIMGENPVLSDPDRAHTVKALSKLDLLVVQDIFPTETTALAHVVLPATAFAEKVGTFTNTERRVQRVRRVVDAPGQAWKDSHIIMELSGRLGYPMHNYLRMLWGKKILVWSASPRIAAEAMIELNNRYALDGRDPNSYSGIYWCLGRYDRPWGPERPIFGTVRSHEFCQHGKEVRPGRVPGTVCQVVIPCGC